jgi:hypothetical protein
MPSKKRQQFLMQGPSAKKKWTAEGRGSGKYQGWSKTGIDTYNALVDVIAKQRKKQNHLVQLCTKLETNICGSTGSNDGTQRKHRNKEEKGCQLNNDQMDYRQ